MRAIPATRRFRPLPLAAAIAMALVPATSHAITYTVTSNLDNSGIDPAPGAGTGTLRQAIIDANANCVADPNPVIAFAIGPSPASIGVGSPFTGTANPLPALQCAGGAYSPTIDGSTQPGSVPNSDPTGFNGVFGISLFDTLAVPGAQCGLAFAQNPAIGGAMTVRGISFAGFQTGGLSVGVCGTNMNLFGNEMVNNNEGVKVLAGGTALIGNTANADRNYIHSNTVFGINSTGANGITAVNNFVGVTTDGNGADGNQIGINAVNVGFMVIQANVVGANTFEGIRLNTVPGIVTGNRIGVGSLGASVPNTTGIRTDNSVALLDVNGNTIHFNSQYGVHVASGVSVGMSNNSISGNGVANVTLDMYGGPVPNDPLDPDTGPNNRQNFPTITSVVPGASTAINFAFNSQASKGYTLEFYTNPGLGIPGGFSFIGTQSVTTNAAGDAVGGITIAGSFDFISAIARDQANNDTSEFSPIVAAAPGTPAVTISPTSLNFPNVVVNTTSASQTATVTSTGTAAYQISQLSTGGSCYGGPICYGGAEFTCSTTCIPFTPYNPSQSCTVTANFHPTALGPQSTDVTICDNATGSPRIITITGNAVAAPAITVRPSFFDFGNVPVGSQSARAFFTLQNSNATPASFTASTNGPFSIVGSNCANPIPASTSCDLDVVYTATTAGLEVGNLAIGSGGRTATASLQGTGILAPQLALPRNIDIAYTLGSPPATQGVSLQNTGQQTLNFTSISISGAPFTLVNNCPSSLPPGSTCNLIIGFSATDRGVFNGTLTIVSNAPGGSAVIPIRGIANPREVPVLEVTPREIGYGDIAFGRATEGERVKVKNIGGAPAVFNSFVVSPDFVILSNTCTAPLAPFDTCEARLAMRPRTYGVRFGELRINSNAENAPNVVNVFGTSCRASSLVLPRLGVARGC